MNDAERIAEIREREKAATPGPWISAPYDRADKWIDVPAPGVRVDYDDVDHDEQDSNAAFIAHARSDIPWLREKVEDLQTILKEFAFLDGITPDGIVDVEQFCVRLRALAAKAAQEKP